MLDLLKKKINKDNKTSNISSVFKNHIIKLNNEIKILKTIINNRGRSKVNNTKWQLIKLSFFVLHLSTTILYNGNI